MPFNAVIPKSIFPTGIVQFTLFSATEEPLNERIAFINHPDELLKLDIVPDKTITAPQGKVKLGLDVRNNDNEPVTGSFSVAVIDEGKVKGIGDKETTILSELLLTADLRGYIEQPAYYFNKSGDTAQNNLDILMLTQGYRRFAWKPLLAGTIPPAVYPAERQAGISGTVKTKSGKLVPGAKVTLIPGDGRFLGLDTIANGQGHFNFTNLLFRDSLKYVLQASSEKNGRNVDILIDDTYDRNPRVAGPYPEVLGPGEKENLSVYLASNKELYRQERKYGLNNRAIVLKEVNIRAVLKPKVEHSDNLNGPGHANLLITAEELEKRGSINLWHTIQKFVVKPMGSPPTNPYSAPAGITFILDGTRVDGTMIDNIPIAAVSSVEYLSSPTYTTIYGPKGQNGVFVITTKGIGDTKASPSKEAAPGILTFTPKGYYLAREFYSPQYDDPKTNKTLANLRNTIYWQPDLVTDQTGYASFEYYNAGSPGTYLVVVEGIGTDGNLGRKVYRYKVE